MEMGVLIVLYHLGQHRITCDVGSLQSCLGKSCFAKWQTTQINNPSQPVC